MAWEIGAVEFTDGTTPVPPIPPAPPLGMVVRIVGKENAIKVTKRKTNMSMTVLITANKDTVVILE